jgi:hypothetical protein
MQSDTREPQQPIPTNISFCPQYVAICTYSRLWRSGFLTQAAAKPQVLDVVEAWGSACVFDLVKTCRNGYPGHTVSESMTFFLPFFSKEMINLFVVLSLLGEVCC